MGVATLSELRRIQADDVGPIKHLGVSHLGRELFVIDAYDPERGGIGHYPDGRQYRFTSLKDLADDLWHRYEVDNN